ncbi:site-2 protease family protein [uncultured Nostoc sp.]|uniref:site-2 protease family protein n=1 Tax=uncultured Nostoc sp. TaxID=340711 RepID=UPI0035C94BC7
MHLDTNKAESQGDNTPQQTGHLTLNPVVHMGKESIIFLCLMGIAWGQMPVNPSKFRSGKLGNILVSAAGPLSNLALGILFIMLLKLFFNPNLSGLLSVKFLYLAARINLTLFLFNLLPIPPLDGFHIFSEIFPQLKPLQYNQFGLFAMMLLFIIPDFGIGISRIADLFIRSGLAM